MAAKPVLKIIGKPANHAPAYKASDWQERDNFESLEQAEDYATSKSRQWSATPYRVRELRGRFVVEFVPQWNLR